MKEEISLGAYQEKFISVRFYCIQGWQMNLKMFVSEVKFWSDLEINQIPLRDWSALGNIIYKYNFLSNKIETNKKMISWRSPRNLNKI